MLLLSAKILNIAGNLVQNKATNAANRDLNNIGLFDNLVNLKV
jgi:hypothetical protein